MIQHTFTGGLFRSSLFALVAALAGPSLLSTSSQAQTLSPAQAASSPAPALMALSELKAGMEGEVRTVFAGTQPEPFKVKVTGVIRNALGPGKSLILCELTDPRVQSMGATAGMSGSPLYIDGKFVGALSYQLQRFETVRYAGFTPAADLVEVRDLPTVEPSSQSSDLASAPVAASAGEFVSLRPTFSVGGVSPSVLAAVSPLFRAAGLEVGALAGSQGGSGENVSPAQPLVPGAPIAAALTTGDISIAGTGTISMVDGGRITAFGHPMLGLGDVDIPMCSAEIVTILPSSMSSMKVANVGGIIGSFRQDRLSAISGDLGAKPGMVDVEVVSKGRGREAKTLHFQTVRMAQLLPLAVATAVSQAVQGSNDTGYTEGFRVCSTIEFPGGRTVTDASLYAGSSAFMQGLREFAVRLALLSSNPYEKIYPTRVSVTVEPVQGSPVAILESFRLSRTVVHSDEPLEASLSWRNYQGTVERQTVTIPVDPAWIGKSLDVVLVNGSFLDEISGRSHSMQAARFRSFDDLLAAFRTMRRDDGLYLVVLEKTALFTDQAVTTKELPPSLERIARQADETRFQRLETLAPLFELHLLPDKVVSAQLRRTVQVVE